MTPQTEPLGGKGTRFPDRRFVASTESTNADLLAAARQGQSGAVVLVTDHQTRGRGRSQRSWQDHPNSSLLVSYAIDVEPAIGWLLPFVAALSARDTVTACCGGPVAALKWPNDVLGVDDEAKVAGILVESILTGTRFRAVVGMGMNLVSDPRHPHYGTLDRLGSTRTRDEVLEEYLAASDRWLSTLETDHRSILVNYRPACLTIGRRVRFEQRRGAETVIVEGTAVDVDEQGRLVIADDRGATIPLLAGDAHHVD